MTRIPLWSTLAACAVGAAGCGAATTIDDITTRLGTEEFHAAPPGEAPPTELAELTADRAVALAARWAPALHLAHAQVVTARGSLRQAGVWANPELEFEVEDGHLDSAGFDGNTVWRSTLRWQLPIYTGRGAKIAAAESELSARRVHVEHARAELEGRVRSAFAHVLAAGQSLTFAELAEALTAEAVATTERLRAGGEADQSQLLQVQIEHDRAEGQVAHARVARDGALIHLAKVIGLPQLRIGTLAGELRSSWPAIDAARALQRCHTFAPEVRAAEARFRAAQAAVTSADRAGWPEPTFSLGTANGRGDDGREFALEWGVGIALPLFDSNRGGVARAQGGVLEAAAEHRAATNEVLAQGRMLVAAYRLAREDLTRYQTHIVPHAEEALRLIQSGFPAQFDLRDLILSQRTLGEARRELVDRLVRLSDAAVALEMLTGEGVDALESADAGPEQPEPPAAPGKEK